ncbi:MAG: DNA polymerase [Buchnera aphidicola (Nurudea shiraii)]
MSKNQYDVTLATYLLNNTLKKAELLNNIEDNWIKNYNTFQKKFKNTLIELKKTYFSLEQSKKILSLYISTKEKIDKNTQTKHIFKNIDLNLIEVLSTIENNGIYISKKILENISNIFNLKLLYLQKKSYIALHKKINLLSNLELMQEIPILKSHKKVNKTILTILSKQYLLPKIILKYRNLYMLKNTYSEKLLNMIDKKTKRIHCCYNQTNTITSRLSSSHPNLQNIPIHNKEGKYIRAAFLAPKDCLLVSTDYSQFELRILAHFSQDEKFLDAFLKDKDIHLITASEIFNTTFKNITYHERHHAKLINFSILYGMSSYGLSKQLNINIKKARNYIQTYKEKYKKIFQYIENTKNMALKNGFVTTLEGRKLFIPNIKSKNKKIQKIAKKTAISAVIQGTTSDIMKISMIKINNLIKQDFKSHAKIVLHIHDELIFEIKKEKIKLFCEKIINIMENIKTLKVPLKINTKIGKNWLEIN